MNILDTLRSRGHTQSNFWPPGGVSVLYLNITITSGVDPKYMDRIQGIQGIVHVILGEKRGDIGDEVTSEDW